jgi:HK97 family phage major capsid protein
VTRGEGPRIEIVFQKTVGAFGSAATIYRRGGLSVEASNSHADYFQKDLVAIRAQTRLALAVYRPEAFATASPSPGADASSSG